MIAVSLPRDSAREEARTTAAAYRLHHRICRLRQSGDVCQWCEQLDTAALDAADAAGITWWEALDVD